MNCKYCGSRRFVRDDSEFCDPCFQAHQCLEHFLALSDGARKAYFIEVVKTRDRYINAIYKVRTALSCLDFKEKN